MTLTKKQTLAILLSTLLFVTSSSTIYLLTPFPQESSTSMPLETNITDSTSSETNNHSVTTSNNVVIENIKLNNNSSLSATINIPTTDIYLACKQLFNKINNDKITEPKVEIIDESIQISFLYKLIGTFNTSVTCTIIPHVSNNQLITLVDNVSIGKIQLNKGFIRFGINKILKNNEYNLTYTDDTITFDLSTNLPESLTISDFELNSSKLSITLNYKLDFLNKKLNKNKKDR